MGVELRDIHKHFGAIRANDGISLEVEAGTLHGLLGENGAGKSTLMKVLSGYHPADSGDILIDGVPVSLGSPDEAIAAGVGMLHQDPLVFLPMTVLENFMLGVPRAKTADRRAAAPRPGRRCGAVWLLVRSRCTCAHAHGWCAPASFEIVRLLWLGAKVLILDEPTTGISAPQRVQLFAALRTLAKAGMTASHVAQTRGDRRSVRLGDRDAPGQGGRCCRDAGPGVTPRRDDVWSAGGDPAPPPRRNSGTRSWCATGSVSTIA